MRENVEAKGRRLLTEGRLTILGVRSRSIDATCRGDSAEVYRLGYRPGGWFCDCAALGKCSHLVALELVTIRPGVAA